MTEKPILQEAAYNPEDLFVDKTPEPTTETTPVVQEQTPKYKIKYNGAEEELSLEEMTTLAQKGKNYDKKASELDQIKNSDENKILLELARSEGFKDIPSYVKSLKDTTYKNKLDAKVNEYVEQGLSAEYAEKLAKVDLANTPKVDDPQVELFTELFTEYPETAGWDSLDKFPQEVAEQINAGKKPIVAYAKYVAEQAKIANSKAALEEANKLKDPGSLKTSDSSGEDPFWQGFMGK